MARTYGWPRRTTVVACMVSLAALVATAFAAGPARAQSSGGGGGKTKSLRVTVKDVERFTKRVARVIAQNQQPIFPNARIYKTGSSASCGGRGRWFRCAWSAYVYEESMRDPGQYEVRQSTFRYCTASNNQNGYPVVEVRRARSSRKLRIASPYLVSCDLTQSSIDSWNVFAYTPDQEWQPLRSEPIEVPQSTLPPPEPAPQELVAPPEGMPQGPPPGPLSVGPEARSTSRATAHASATTGGTGYLWRGGSWLGCSEWQRYQYDTRYFVFYCYWRPPAAATLPGAALGIFTQDVVTYWEGYYWVGNDNYGRPQGKLFSSGQY